MTVDELSTTSAEVGGGGGGVEIDQGVKGLEGKWRKRERIDKRKMELSWAEQKDGKGRDLNADKYLRRKKE